MTKAEAQMDPLITDMAIIFPWQNPQTQLNSALPWIEFAVTAVLSFVPFFGILLGAGAEGGAFLGGIVTTAGELANGGLQQLQQEDPVAQILGNIEDLGISIETDFKHARTILDSWSTTIFSGAQDASNRTIIDYMASGRFTINYNSDPPDSTAIAEFYFQILVSQYANQEWLNNSNTYVMCTNATDVACEENSLYTNSNRSCCLYSLDNDANYIDPPPGLPELANSTYGIPPPNITASSLASYLAAKYNYTASTFYSTLDTQVLLDPSQQAFAQGASFQGVYTLPVCDVPASHSSWVANYSADLLSCCCGVDCSETRAFFEATRMAGSHSVNSKCQSQFPGFTPISAAPRGAWVGGLGVGLLEGVALLWVAVFWFL
ncbi:hypothetical protein MMC26_001684 [Xylographa opegraphella]|nr:hypothetical protein [Xylographa opegraphella]